MLRLPAAAPGGPAGRGGTGFGQLTAQLPPKRLSIAWRPVVVAEQAAVRWTVAYTLERQVFGRRPVDFQNTLFRL
ncbi:acyl-CoA dehydrogenase family protein [Streptomyces hyaluromycini]|uniref:Acyl-CoA dehydrogenase family protein n=1 Tax=Streptomyces hyaluromycini TaxID=1377993 RepID=A0ABV1XA93_9ACTN